MKKLLGGRRRAQEHKDCNLQQKILKPTWKERYNPIAQQDEEIAHFKVQIFEETIMCLKLSRKNFSFFLFLNRNFILTFT